jgi:thiol-disulfide isomerase/thioredoxin
MYSKIKLVLCFIFVAFASNAQNINMEFPAFAGRTYDFIIFQGSKAVTVMQDTIPKNGKFILTIPVKYTPYTGMCRWLLTNTEQGGGLDMAIPGYDYSIVCMSDKPDNTNIIFTGFDAVNELNRLDGIQKLIIDKFETISRASKLYDKTNHLFATFENEKEVLIKSYYDFHKDLKKNPNFNARFLPIVNLIQGYANHLSDDNIEKGLIFNAFFTHEMNIQDLYVSGHWEGIIKSWVAYQSNVVNDKDKFVNDFTVLNNKIKNKEQYTDFVGKVTYFLTQNGKDDFIEAISPIVIHSKKISSYENATMQVYVKAMIGSQAPDLVITEHIGKFEDHNHKKSVIQSKNFASKGFKKTLLLFYQSGCGPCEELMQQLPGLYEKLKSKGIRIISIAADESEQVYKNASNSYPWSDKYCDYEGKNGINFINYAVLGTPTLFLIDQTGKIEKKLASFLELLD